MSEARKNEILEDFRRSNPRKSSRSRDLKERLHLIRSKETFLTDTQTSDYTKSSGQINSPRVEHLKELIRKLERENAELRQKVIDLKASQCFEVNEQKLKSMIMQNDHLRDELENTKKQLEQSLVERDFLQRFNKNLKVQCESLTKEILILKATGSTVESKKIEKNIYTAREEGQCYKSRNQSKDSVLSGKKKQFLNLRREKEEKQKQSSATIKSCLSASRLHEDYYGGRTSRQRPFKNH